MSSSTPEASEDVNDFLQRIKELGDRRDQEDEERNRKLEEEILQGRKERQARRAERARSISPTKSSPANTPSLYSARAAQASGLSESISSAINPQQAFEPRQNNTIDAMEGSSTSPTKENNSPFDGGRDISDPDVKSSVSTRASPSAMSPARNSPLSWQRRPNSQASDRPRSRPLSMVATENAARSPRSTPGPESDSAAEPVLSREQIAQSLASKDPAWFRQTSDRGLSSPAYRRNQVEDPDRADHGLGTVSGQLPGMSRQTTEIENEDLIDRSSSPSRSSAGFDNAARSSHSSATRLSGSIGSPIPLTSAQRLDPPTLDSRSESRGLAMSPSQGRISPERLERAVSPTKGMGGFVQSAMMKRSDSVNKRWSVQSPTGLSRGNSVASNRISPGPGSLALSGTVNTSHQSNLSRDNSPKPPSRPTSSHGNATLTPESQRPGNSSSMKGSMTASASNDGLVKPPVPAFRSETSLGSKPGEDETTNLASRPETPPPSSPSKTMDTRRWSPAKSSWLESALNKPESPKPKPTPPSQQQPTWMSEINKAKQKGSVDLGRSSATAPKHEVKIGGLIRSLPPGGLTKPLTIGGLPAGFSSGVKLKARSESANSQDSSTLGNMYSKEDIGEAASATLASLKGLPTLDKVSPSNGRAKPETPPKKDFRSVLKPRQLPEGKETDAPEFKNVFGQLRKTKTQNYVAPDELKDNITRGKAQLNITGGPKKTERKDEFKEAILKKKEDFKKAQLEGKGVTRSGSVGDKEVPVPEAIAKKKALGRADSTASEARIAPSDPPPPQRADPVDSNISLPQNEIGTPSRLQGKETASGKLAGRLNPALAGLLARGPPSVASNSSRSSSPALSQRTISMSTSTTNTDTPEAGPQLTHMTKGRARGPRRKAPSNIPTNQVSDKVTNAQPLTISSSDTVSHPPVISEAKIPESDKVVPQSPLKVDTTQPASQSSSPQIPNTISETESQSESPKILSPTSQANFLEKSVKNQERSADMKAASGPTSLPDPSAKSPMSGAVATEIPPIKSPIKAVETSKFPSIPFSSAEKATERLFAVSSVDRKSPDLKSNSCQPQNSLDAESVVSVKEAAALWTRPSANVNASNPPRARSPIKLPTKDDEKRAMKGAGLRSPSPVKERPTGLGLGLQQPKNQLPPSSRPHPTPPMIGALSAPSSAGLVPPATPTKANASPVPHTSEASMLVANFFDDHKSPTTYVVDTASMLSSRPNQGAIVQTLRSRLYQLSGDGKKQQVPVHQERILFEGNCYICVHSFNNAAGKKLTEVYFWYGDDVATSVVEDLQIFAQREAKSAGGKLLRFKQGKETPEFFQALGGIVIIRRGSSNKYDSLAPHILCGRSFFGQVAFDEVDYSPASLCSGFPYLISTQSTKSYLWKGKGSGIEELSCARLIGMDFGLTGEIEEVEDGKEPASFLQIFGIGAKIPMSADHWRLKPSYNKYCGRLFCADSAANKQIIEITPFNQADISPSNIYILDAFFEIYIIVGSRSQSQYSAFHHSLLFAQEYGILAAGMEDRPFVPVSTVVIEGVPKDLKSVFRKWSDSLTPTVLQPVKSLSRGRSLRVVPLTAALEATRV